MERAQSLVQAAVAEANKRGWKMNVAVVDPNGDLIAFGRMDGAQSCFDPHFSAKVARSSALSAADPRT